MKCEAYNWNKDVLQKEDNQEKERPDVLQKSDTNEERGIHVTLNQRCATQVE